MFLEIRLRSLSTCANDQQLETGDLFLAASFCQLLFAFCCPYAQSISPSLLHDCLNLHFQQIHWHLAGLWVKHSLKLACMLSLFGGDKKESGRGAWGELCMWNCTVKLAPTVRLQASNISLGFVLEAEFFTMGNRLISLTPLAFNPSTSPAEEAKG